MNSKGTVDGGVEKRGKVVVFACFGGFSNTGIATALASMDAISEVGLDKASIGCLASVPLGTETVRSKCDAATKIVVVDGCPTECARKLVEKAGYTPSKAFVLARDIGMEKKSLYEDPITIGDVIKSVEPEELRRAKELIVKAIME